MKKENFRDISYSKDDSTGIVTLTLNAPKRKNAMSPYTFLELFWAVDIFEQDTNAGAMIITGARTSEAYDPQNEAFSSGGYFHPDSLKGIPDELLNQVDLSDIAQKKMTLKMFNCDKPIIAAINGLAIGAGYTMPLSGADLIYMSEHAWIRLPFSTLGIVPEFALTFLLPRMMGFQKAKDIIYFAKTITAKEALELGMANEVLPHDELLPFAREQALKLIPPNGAGMAIRQIKKAFHKPFIDAVSKSLDLENEGLSTCFATGDFNEGMAARIEKRAPVFKGE
ncbi:enoyl-CoA hydratase/isomerase family protein [bacterium]|nr:enoyl-CoA hydratase/isomerase family protein [bacterium]